MQLARHLVLSIATLAAATSLPAQRAAVVGGEVAATGGHGLALGPEHRTTEGLGGEGGPECGGRNPGSVLIYPIHRSGAGLFTILCTTNTATDPITPTSFGGSTGLHYEYVNVTPNPADPFQPLGCVIFDRHEFVTPADTMSVLTECHNATTPGGQEGYVVVSAEDPERFRTAFSHNFLIGSEVVLSASGFVYAVNAIPVCSPLPQGTATDLNANQKLDFDGIEYDPLAEYLMIDSFIALGDANLTLINLTGNSSDANTVFFSVWNDNEFPLSASLLFSCWFDQPLSAVSPLFTQNFLQSTAHDPRELDLDCDGAGDLETGWAIIDSIDVSHPLGPFVANDGVILGSITVGRTTVIEGGRLLWESAATQNNGVFLGRPGQPVVQTNPGN